MIGEWTDANVARLRELWIKGYSASQIAADLHGDISRSAVLGKAMRLKLSRRRDAVVMGPRHTSGRHISPMLTAAPTSPRPRHNVTRLQATANGHNKAPPERRNPTNSLTEKIAIAEAEPGLPPRLKGEAPDGTGIQLRDLDASNCHFPRGDPLQEGFEFCGKTAIPGMPYCASHCRLAYAPAQDRRREVRHA